MTPPHSNPEGGVSHSLPFILAIGVLSTLFFSSTWIVNRWISLQEGPWEWNALLRYPLILVMIAPWLALRGRDRGLGAALRLFRARPMYWIVAGTFGCGFFYTGICFAGDQAPGWVLATTYQITILLSPVVLRLFGLRVPMRGLLLMALIFVGAVMVNATQIHGGLDPGRSILAAIALVIAAFFYPLGNQMLNLARSRAGERADSSHRALGDPFFGLFLMSLGSLPFWLLLLLATRPEAPPPAQLGQIALVAVSSGMIATGLFFWARNATHDPYVIAAVDATQAFEVVMAILGEALLLGGAWPGPVEWAGIMMVVAGVVGLSLRPRQRAPFDDGEETPT